MTETLAATDIKKLGTGPGLISPQRLDIQGYVDDFNTSVIDAYRRGVADLDLPADEGVGRSLIAPATAGVRDFSTLSPLIPGFDAEKCVGCMACVSACPDSAIMATAQPKGSLGRAIEAFAAEQPNAALAATTARSHFVHTTKYADVPAKKGIEGADFGLFIDPAHCKGCAECVDVCVAAGPQRPDHGREVRRRSRRRDHARPLPPRHRLLQVAAADPGRVPQREGPRGPDARRARLRLRRWRGLVLRLRRRHGRPHGRRRHAPGLRTAEHGHRGRDRLQHRLRQHLSRTTRSPCRGPTRCSRTARPTPWASGCAGTRTATPTGGCGSSAATAPCTTSASSRCRAWSPRAWTSRSSSSTPASTRTPAARPRRPRSPARSPSSPPTARPSTASRRGARSSAGS